MHTLIPDRKQWKMTLWVMKIDNADISSLRVPFFPNSISEIIHRLQHFWNHTSDCSISEGILPIFNHVRYFNQMINFRRLLFPWQALFNSICMHVHMQLAFQIIFYKRSQALLLILHYFHDMKMVEVWQMFSNSS